MYNIDRLYKGRSFKKGNPERNFRAGVKTRANATIREDRDRSARESDRRDEQNARGE
jgi:hypothetical protein